MRIRIIRRAGFTLTEIMIVVSLIGLLATIAVPNWLVARMDAQKAACINNLRQIDNAIQQYALDSRKGPTSRVDISDLLPYLRNDVVCPAGGTTPDNSYSVTDVQTPPTCISPGGGPMNGHMMP